jgi:hexulose-6-phosphate isomerase
LRVVFLFFAMDQLLSWRALTHRFSQSVYRESGPETIDMPGDAATVEWWLFDLRGCDLKFSVQSSCLPGQPQDAAKLAAQAGCEAIEWAGQLAPCDELLAATRQAGIESSGVYLGPLTGSGLADKDQALRAVSMECIRAGLESAAKIGASSIVVRPATLSSEVDYQSAFWGILESMAKLRFDAQRRAVRIVLDMAGSGLASAPMELRTLIDQINSAWVTASLDIDHIATLGSPLDWFGLLGRRATHFYVSDGPADLRAIAGAINDCWCEGHIVFRGVKDVADSRRHVGDLMGVPPTK